MDSPAFFIFLFIHLTCLIIAFGSVLVTDHFGLRWMRDRVPFERLMKTADVTQKLIWFGWSGMVLSGAGLLYLKWKVDPLFMLKLFCVLVAGVNGLALHFIFKSVQRYEKSDTVPTLLMFRLGLALMVSQVVWWGAFVIGFLHRHVWTVIDWPPVWWLWAVLFTAAVLLVWGLGEWKLRQSPSRVQVEDPDETPTKAPTSEGPVVDPLGKA